MTARLLMPFIVPDVFHHSEIQQFLSHQIADDAKHQRPTEIRNPDVDDVPPHQPAVGIEGFQRLGIGVVRRMPRQAE